MWADGFEAEAHERHLFRDRTGAFARSAAIVDDFIPFNIFYGRFTAETKWNVASSQVERKVCQQFAAGTTEAMKMCRACRGVGGFDGKSWNIGEQVLTFSIKIFFKSKFSVLVFV